MALIRSAKRTRIVFTSDLHGSETAFRKWLAAVRSLRADVLVFGGDLAGKTLQPLIRSGSRLETVLFGRTEVAETAEEAAALRARIRGMGRYDVEVDAGEKAQLDASEAHREALFADVARRRAEEWLELADARLREAKVPAFMMLGNDDYPAMKAVFDQSDCVTDPEDRVVELPGGYEMVSLGYANPTPWHTPRELAEAEMRSRLDTMASRLRDPGRAVFNVHAPPVDTALDQAPLLDEQLRPLTIGGQTRIGGVGSTAVREALERYEPMLGLHGHIHESPGMTRLGRTTAINPGSDYADGVLRAAVVTLDDRRGVRGWQLIQG